jgi:hypothetical protein
MQLENSASSEGDERNRRTPAKQEYFTIQQIADRWCCARSTVYARLRAVGAEVLDFAPRGKKGKKLVRVATVSRIEEKQTRRLY